MKRRLDANETRKLGVETIDLLILHQALPSELERTLDAYRALERLLDDGKVRAIGVSNFMVEHLTTLLDRATSLPSVNQIEVHPYLTNDSLRLFGVEHGIHTEAWSPIAQGKVLEDPTLVEIAERVPGVDIGSRLRQRLLMAAHVVDQRPAATRAFGDHDLDA